MNVTSMQYAIVNGVRQEAIRPKEIGICELCGGKMNSKSLGIYRVRHWAHISKENCDHWYEEETKWHRDWKAKFPEKWREVVIDKGEGKKHRADVKTDKDVVIEFQHSPISLIDVQARETFYEKLIWVVSTKDERFELEDNLENVIESIEKNYGYKRADIWIEKSEKINARLKLGEQDLERIANQELEFAQIQTQHLEREKEELLEKARRENLNLYKVKQWPKVGKV